MKSKPKILFVYEHKYPELWMDGLWAALQVLEGDFEIERKNIFNRFISCDTLTQYKFVLGWGAFHSKVDSYLQTNELYGNPLTKYGLCIAGNATPSTGADNYDVLFYETKWYRPQINFHKNIVQAFGVNTDLYFKPDISCPIVWDYIGVGALANWKRWEKMTAKKGTRLVIGEYQEENKTESLAIADNLLSHGVMVSPMVSPFNLSNFYNWSRTLYMPSDINGGGERAILEARSCGLDIEIEDDNPKLLEVKQWDPIPDHHWYAAQLKKGILSVL